MIIVAILTQTWNRIEKESIQKKKKKRCTKLLVWYFVEDGQVGKGWDGKRKQSKGEGQRCF